MIDREAWERRWNQAPELRPEGVNYQPAPVIDGSCVDVYVGWLLDERPMIGETTAEALICWRAVEWLVGNGVEVVLRSHGVSNQAAISAVLLEAVEWAVDMELEARHAKAE